MKFIWKTSKCYLHFITLRYQAVYYSFGFHLKKLICVFKKQVYDLKRHFHENQRMYAHEMINRYSIICISISEEYFRNYTLGMRNSSGVYTSTCLLAKYVKFEKYIRYTCKCLVLYRHVYVLYKTIKNS